MEDATVKNKRPDSKLVRILKAIATYSTATILFGAIITNCVDEIIG